MRIAIDALGIHNYGGGRSAILTLLEEMFFIDHENEYVVFLNRSEHSLDIYKDHVHQVISPFMNRFLARIWAQIVFPLKCKKIDLIHFTKNLGVFGLNLPSVVTIHDLTTIIHPELFPKLDVWYWKTIEKKTVNLATRIIAVSKTTASDLQKIYGLSTDKITIINNSISPRFTPASIDEIEVTRKKYRLPDTYILHVGRIDLKKRLTLLVEAFALAKKVGGKNYTDRLVIVGETYQKSKDDFLLPTIDDLGLVNEVIFTGGVPDEDLPSIYTGARITVSASIHEGFGLSAVESLACGTPLIAYHAGALKEVVGEAAFLLESLDKESLANAIIQITNDTSLHQHLRQKGIIQAQQYQSEKNALQTLKLYEEICK